MADSYQESSMVSNCLAPRAAQHQRGETNRSVEEGSPAPNQRSEAPTIKVGQTLWWVSSANSNAQGEVIVVGIDGALAMLSNGLVLNLGNMNCVPDPISRGRCFLNREEHEASLRLIDEWAGFCRDIGAARIPVGMQVQDIRALRLRLGLGEDLRRHR